MISTSSGFQTLLLNSSRHFMAQILHGDSVLDCDIKRIRIYKGACGDSTLTIGSVYSSYAELTLEGLTTLLENEDIEIKLGMTVSGQPEYITIGKFTVSKVKASAYETNITASGFISSKLSADLPALQAQTIPNIIAGITSATGIPVTLSGLTSAGTITVPMTGMSCREALGLVTFLLGGYATETATGGIQISKYQIPANKLAVNGDRMLSEPTFADNAFTMTGVKVIVSEESYDDEGELIPEVSYETATTVRQIYENKYMTQALFNTFKNNVVGYTYMPGDVDLSLGDPRLEPWDCLAVTDLSSNTYNVPCLQIVHTFDGGLSTEVIAEGSSESDNGYEGSITKQLGQINTELIQAQDGASKAKQAADAAQASADGAAAAASAAQTSADSAAEAAGRASSAAGAAQAQADSAAQAASNAWTRAGNALDAANSAQNAADNANKYANGALDQISVIQDVIGVLTWASEHGSFTRTTDTTVQEGKVYFTYDSSTGDYTPVIDPQQSALNTYYELIVNEAMQSFIMAHLAVTSRGLWVLPSGMGTATDAQYAPNYKALLSSSGLLIYDGSGNLVSTFGESISFSATRSQRIGGTNNYIEFNPTTGGITIVGANIVFGSNKNLNDVLTDVDVSVTQTASGADITVNGDTVSIANGAKGDTGEQGPKGDKGDTGSAAYTWIRYSQNANGNPMVATPTSETLYIGIYTGTSSTAPSSYTSYTWSRYIGSQGESITVSSIRYAISTTEAQPADSAFTYTSVPTVAEGSWLWTRTTYSDESKVYTKSKQGRSGTNGTTFTPSVDANGNISWTNDGGKTNPTTQNITGPQGDEGTGVTGVTPFYRLATTTPTKPADDTMTPSGWLPTEPDYDANYNCYVSFRTVYDNGDVRWSDVSKSSSYEAAKQAYNEASVTSQNLAENYSTTADMQEQINNAVADEALARERANAAKLDRMSGNGVASWDEYGTLTITRSNPSTNETYSVVVGADGIEFQYQGQAAASINQDRLVIDKTVVLDEMQVGNSKWTWKIDPNDNTIFLKWIG